MKASQLNKEEYNVYYQTYISKTGGLSLLKGLVHGFNETYSFLNKLSDEQFDYAYADGKWTIKEVLQHIIDTERVFAYRALCFARKDKTELPGYNQDDYAAFCNANSRSKVSLLEEYTNVRKSTINLFKSFTDKMLLQSGIASSSNLSVRAAGFILIGHEKHHCQVIAERYL